MSRLHLVAFLVTVIASCSGGSSSPGGAGGEPGPAPGGGSGGAKATGGSGGSAQGGTSGTGGNGGGMSEGTGGAAGATAPATGGSGGSGAGGAGGSGPGDAGPVDGGGGDTGGGAPNPGNLIWYADPEKGDTVFKNVERQDACTVTVVDDPEHGKVRKFNRPPGTNRCEAKGAAGYDTKEGDLVYVGMRYKIEAPMSLTVTGIFQWKTYDTPGHPNTLNFPLLMRTAGGRLTVEIQKPATAQGGGGLSGGHIIWSMPTPIGQWFTMVIGIKQSYDAKNGWVEVYYNGQQQKLADGSMRVACQTLDGGFIDPKWGIYGTTSSPKPQSATFISDIRLGRDYASAAPESY
jgi:Polysaccharide lyase